MDKAFIFRMFIGIITIGQKGSGCKIERSLGG
jgi:hypothetical protein